MNEKKLLEVLEGMIGNRWYIAQHTYGNVSKRATIQAVELEGVRLLFTDPEYRELMYALYVDKEGN